MRARVRVRLDELRGKVAKRFAQRDDDEVIALRSRVVLEDDQQLAFDYFEGLVELRRGRMARARLDHAVALSSRTSLRIHAAYFWHLGE
jgi:hypothetical protein